MSVGELAGQVEALILGFYERYRPPIVYVGFSGGKDSAAVLAAAARVGVPFAAFFWHIPGQTVADNLQAAMKVARVLGLAWETITVRDPRELSKTVWPWDSNRLPEPGRVYHVIVAQPYVHGLARYGPPPPPPYWRWCCKLYKEEPLHNLPPVARDPETGRPARFIITGVKPSDSPARARRWAQGPERRFRAPRHIVDVALAPLYLLDDSQVWQLLRHYGIHDIVYRQYEKWGRSPNCALCPLATKRQLQQAAQLLPRKLLQQYLQALRPWMDKYTIAKRMAKIIEETLEQANNKKD